MTNLTGNHGSLFSRTTATGLALLLFLSPLSTIIGKRSFLNNGRG